MSEHLKITRDIHTPEWWNDFELQIDKAYEPFQGMDYANVTDDVRTDILAVTAHHVAQLHLVLRTLALESPPKPPRKPRTLKPKAGDDQ